MDSAVPVFASYCVAATRSEEETRRLGALLAESLPGGITILLKGDLGAGKTAFVRGFCEALGFLRVRSPSFTLVNRYRAGEREIVHADLYRLEGEDVGDLDLSGEETGSSVLFVEWAERSEFSSDRPLWTVNIVAPDIQKFPERRFFSFRSENVQGEEILAPLRKIIEERFPS